MENISFNLLPPLQKLSLPSSLGGWLSYIYMVLCVFKPQQKCCNFEHLGSDSRILRFELLQVDDRISFGHNLLYELREMVALHWLGTYCFYCQIAHLGLEGWMPCSVETPKRTVEMFLIAGYMFHHNFP